MFPHSFAQHNLSKCVGEIKLEGPSGWVWPCSLEKDGDSMLLTKPGWEKFSLNHNLKEGDTLLFTYVGRNLFKVRIFEREEGIEKGRNCFPSSIKLLCSTHVNKGHATSMDCLHGKINIKNHKNNDKSKRSTSSISSMPHNDFASNDENNQELVRSLDPNTCNIDHNAHGDQSSLEDLNDTTNGLVPNANDLSAPCTEDQIMGAFERAKYIHETIAQKIENPSVTKLMNISTIQKAKLVSSFSTIVCLSQLSMSTIREEYICDLLYSKLYLKEDT